MEVREAKRIQEKLRDERKPKKLKKFYKKATVKGKKAPYGIALDGKPVKTPLKAALELPTRALARQVVAEWNDQGKFVKPETMYLTKYANTAVDRVEPRKQAIVDEIVAFASSDLVCYRAETPQGLVDRQSIAWDLVLKWAADEHQLNFTCIAGVMYASQPDNTLAATHDILLDIDAFSLTAIHNLTTLTGSALLALAVTNGFLSDDDAWNAAHVDEDWNIEQWGADDDALAQRNTRRAEYDGILQFYRLVK